VKMGGLSQLPLLESVSKYLPRLLIQQRFNRPRGQSVFADFFQGSLLFADISGFTAISEKLAASGKRGAEELTSIMNRAFASLTRIIFRHGGDILKFGGDAALVFFRGEHHPLQGLCCGNALQGYMQKNCLVETSQGTFPLELHLGVHTGNLLSASVGEVKSKLEHIVLGRDVNLTFRAAEQAAKGEIRITPDCYERVSEGVEVQPASSDLLLVKKVLGAWTPPVQADPCLKKGDPLALKAYLPVGIYDKLQALEEIRGVEAEHRRVTVMFVNFHDFGDFIEKLAGNRPREMRAESKEELLHLLNLYFTRTHRIISAHGGVLTRIDTYSRGDKMLILFGAPVSHEDDELRALHCALEMNSELEKINQKKRFRIWQRIGINSGHAFCGDVGGRLRKEYTVMGDDVNLAARLMSKAEPGQILVGENTYLKGLRGFDFSPLPPLKVKGKKEPLEVFSLEAKRSTIAARRTAPSAEVRLIGRQKEVEILRQATQEVLFGRGEVILVTGEAGVGKSRLTQELKRLAEEKGLGGFETACQSYGGSIPYLPWNSLLRELLEIDPEAGKKEAIAKLKEQLSCFDNPDWYPLLGSPLGTEFPDNDTTARLEGKLRQHKTFQLLAGILENRLGSSGFYIIFEDLHWIDEVSHLLLKFISENLNGSPLLLVLVSRPHESLAWWKRKKPRLLDLEELSAPEAHHLVKSLLKTDKPPEELTELVVEKSGGNPFFLEEIIHSLLDSEILVRNHETGDYQVKGSISQINLPDNIEGVIQSRIDLLDETSKQVLKVAAILGRSFSFEALKVIFPYSL
jgi:class 3 adenylate cyclase